MPEKGNKIAAHGVQACRQRLDGNAPQRGGPQQVAQIDLRPSVDPTDARNTEDQVALGVSVLLALRTSAGRAR
jgi:hypothetical protein